jgi:hypothetical protein
MRTVKLTASGTIRIPSLVVTISNQSRDAFGNFLYGGWNAQQKKIFSNALTLTVKPLLPTLVTGNDIIAVNCGIINVNLQGFNVSNITFASNAHR